MRLSPTGGNGADGASASSNDRSSDPGGGSRLGRAARTVALGVVAGALAYLAIRRRRSLDVDSPAEESREVADDLIPEDATVEIGEPWTSDDGEERSDGMRDRSDAEGAAGDATDESEEAKPEAIEPDESELEATESEAADEIEELPGEDRSAEEIVERGEENVQETPAEPGEMTVDDDLVDDLIDEGDVDEETDSDEETDPDSDEETDPDSDEETDPDSDEETDPDSDEETDPDSDEETNADEETDADEEMKGNETGANGDRD